MTMFLSVRLPLMFPSIAFSGFIPYIFTGDVSIRVQNPGSPHLVPCSFDGRKSLGPAGEPSFAPAPFDPRHFLNAVHISDAK